MIKMVVKNILVVLLLVVLVNIAEGSPFRRTYRARQPSRRMSVNAHSARATAKNENPEELNEYALIHEARRQRQESSPRHSAVRSTGFFRKSSPFASSKGEQFDIPSLHSGNPGYTRRAALTPERRVVLTPVVDPWHKASSKMSTSRKVVDIRSQNDADYAY